MSGGTTLKLGTPSDPSGGRRSVAVALKLQVGVGAEGQRVAEIIDLHGMIDDQFGGQQRIDALRVAAHLHHGVAHGGQIDDGRHAGEVLQQDAGRHEGDFLAGLGFRLPVGQRFDVLGAHGQAVLAAEQVFEEDFE